MYEGYKSTNRYKGAGERGGASNGCLSEPISAHPRYKGSSYSPIRRGGGLGFFSLTACRVSQHTLTVLYKFYTQAHAAGDVLNVGR